VREYSGACASGTLKYIIRNVTAVIPAIVISPLGKALVAYRGELDSEKKKLLAQMLSSDIQAALEFAHRRRVFHLDVRLDNIIYDSNADVFCTH
jgi:serine/threonine protein kinase